MILFSFLTVLVLVVCFAQEFVNNPAIVRPCPAFSPDCIQEFVAQNSWCQPVFGPPSDVLPIELIVMPLPHGNATFYWVNGNATGLGNTKILEFYVNRQTNNLLMEIELDDFTIYSPTSYLTYYFKGREPVTLSDYLSYTYQNLSVTATVPFDSYNGISWPRLVAFAYFRYPTAPVKSGGHLVNSDPDILATFEELLGPNLRIGMKEASPVLAPYFFSLYMNNYVCRIN